MPAKAAHDALLVQPGKHFFVPALVSMHRLAMLLLFVPQSLSFVHTLVHQRSLQDEEAHSLLAVQASPVFLSAQILQLSRLQLKNLSQTGPELSSLHVLSWEHARRLSQHEVKIHDWHSSFAGIPEQDPPVPALLLPPVPPEGICGLEAPPDPLGPASTGAGAELEHLLMRQTQSLGQSRLVPHSVTPST
ncbi:MAG: hypothetical protein SF187_06630 [Deltaproteobacteria bacterium]|nr:hypothetical protein [Deltaproteobacteria bacterium]